MNLLYITSDRPSAGKTVVATSLLATLLEEGQSVGYFKPFCADPSSDGDVAFAREVAAKGNGSVAGDPLPLRLDALPGAIPAAVLEQVKAAVDAIATNYGTLIIEGPSLHLPNGDLSDLSYHLAYGLDAKVLVVIGYTPGLNVEEIARTVGTFGDMLLGTIINSVTRHRIRETKQSLSQPAASEVKLLGVIPEDRLMLAVTLGQVAEHLNGQWVMGGEKADDLVESFLIGGNIMDSGETYFGRTDANAVIVRGDRPDIQLAALAASTRGLILTGGHSPVEYVYHEVEQLKVPLMVVPAKTVAAAEALGSAFDWINPYHSKKLARFQQLLHQHCDLKSIWGSLA